MIQLKVILHGCKGTKIVFCVVKVTVLPYYIMIHDLKNLVTNYQAYLNNSTLRKK